MSIDGTNGNDNKTGTTGDDIFDMSQGGRDKVHGLEGNDDFRFGAELGADDRIFGGIGTDDVFLDGDYSGGLKLKASSFDSVEAMVFTAGHSYDITIVEENAAGGNFSVNAGLLTATDSLTFDASRDTDTHFNFTEGFGNDTLIGGQSSNSFNLTRGGSDTVVGGAGLDLVSFLGTFDATDSIDGKDGTDFVSLFGDYSAGMTLSAGIMKNVEVLQLGGDFNYDFTAKDNVIAPLVLLFVDGSTVTAGHSVSFDGHNEHDGKFSMAGGAGDDVFKAGDGNDTFSLLHGGNDIAIGNDGLDTFVMDEALNADDEIDGGAGLDIMTLDGDYSAGVEFNGKTMKGIETIILAAGNDYSLTLDKANLATGETLTVSAALLGSTDRLTFDGSQETDASLVVTGGGEGDTLSGGGGTDTLTGNAGRDTLNGFDGNDILNGGNDKDTLFGGLGRDTMNGGSKADTFIYNSVSESTGVGRDTIEGFDASADLFDLTFSVTGIDAEITTGTLSEASFDSDLAAAVAAMGGHHAVIFTADAGGLDGHTFLIIGHGGGAGYQSGLDIVIELVDPVDTAITLSTFSV